MSKSESDAAGRRAGGGRLARRALALAAACAVLTMLGGCGGEDESVVLYVSADDFLARQVVQRFEEQTGIDVHMVGDTEATKTTGLANRLQAEADNPQADVFWSSECFMTIQLARDGVFAPYESAATVNWPEQYRDPDNLWYGFARRARVIVYNTHNVSEDEIPDQWTDLKAERWKGKVVMADPRFGTTRGHMGAMQAYWSGQFGKQAFEWFLTDLANNDVRLLTSGNAGVVQAVASGEADIGMTDTDDVWAAQRNGQPVDLVYPYHGLPDHEGEGTLLIPNTVARVKGGPNPDTAGVLIDFLLSEEVERLLAESDSHNIPVRPDLAAEFPEYRVEHELEISYEAAALAMDEAVDTAMTILAPNGG